MSWQRFNTTTNVFEVSEDNGASWSTLVIAAAGLALPATPSNLAYTNVANVFTQKQTISMTNAGMNITDTSAATDNKTYDIVTASTLLYIRSLTDANTVVSNGIVINRSGDITVGRDSYAVRNIISNGGYVFATSDLYGSTGIYERGRSAHVGAWTDFTPALYNHGSAAITISTNYSWRYMLVGKTCFLNLYIAVSNPVTTNTSFFYLPLGMTAANHTCNVGLMDNGTSGTIFINTTPGGALVNIYRAGLVNYPVGACSLMGTATIPVQ